MKGLRLMFAIAWPPVNVSSQLANIVAKEALITRRNFPCHSGGVK
jgi:hypothetical protein